MFDPKAVAEMIVKSRKGASDGDEDMPSGVDALRSFAEALKGDDYETAYDALQAAVQSCIGEGEPPSEG